MIEYLKAFFRAVADFFASLAAKYKIYVERENAKARAEAKANAVAMAEQAMLTDYQVVADIIATANNNLALADPNVLRPVNDFSQIFNNRPVCARRTANGRDVFGWCFRLRRSRGCSAAASTLKRELQAEVAAVATAYGYPPLCVDVRYREDNVVGVFLSFQLTRYMEVLTMPARDAAVGLLLLVLADVGLSPEEILVAEGYPHFQATATLLLRDDFELPIERIVQLLDSYAKVSRHIFYLSDVDEMPAPQNNFHFVTLTVST